MSLPQPELEQNKRHMLISVRGIEGQKKLKAAKVASSEQR